MRQFILHISSFLFGILGNAQDNQTPQLYSQLKIDIKDVVNQEKLFNLDLYLCSEQDTITYHIDSMSNLQFQLKFPGRWSATLIKEGYDTLLVEWFNPEVRTELVLECYLPKTKLSFSEKRSAHANSRNLPEVPCTNCGGFQRISVGYNEMCVMRMYEYQQDEKVHSSYEFRKLRFY